MDHSSAEIPGAVAAGLGRILADTFAVRLLTELALWQADAVAPPALSTLLRRQHKSLDKIARSVACRLRVLGGTPPGSLEELRGLASITDLRCPNEAGKALDQLVAALLRIAENFDSMGVIARESADAATAQLLFGFVAIFQETVWRLSEARRADY